MAFVDREAKLWSWIGDGAGFQGAVSNLANRYRPDNWAQHLKNLLNENRDDDFKNAMTQRYNSDQQLCAIDFEAQAIAKLGQTAPEIAVVALATIHGSAPVWDQVFHRSIRNRLGVAH